MLKIMLPAGGGSFGRVLQILANSKLNSGFAFGEKGFTFTIRQKENFGKMPEILAAKWQIKATVPKAIIEEK